MKRGRNIIDTSTKKQGSRGEVDLGRSESGARTGEKRAKEWMESGSAKVEGVVGGVLIYTWSMPGVYFLTVSPGGVYSSSKAREVGCASTTMSHTEVDTGIVGQMK